MKRILPLAVLLAATPATAQTDAQVNDALNNVQHEISRCIGYYTIVQACVENKDPNLASKTAEVRKHLVELASQVGSAIGMTQDAMTYRVTTEQEQMQTMIRNDCVNISSLYGRHAMRCKQVVENGDSVFFEYLRTEE